MKIQNAAPFLEDMLNSLGIKYEHLMFDVSFFSDGLDKFLTEHPECSKYRYHNYQNREDRIGSLRYDWKEGNIFADDEDKDTVFEIFRKIKRRIDLSGGYSFSGVDWFGTGVTGCAFRDYKAPKPEIKILPLVYDNCIKIRYNCALYLSVGIEVTSDGDEPKDAGEIIKKLVPFLGEPKGPTRTCVFDLEEQARIDEKRLGFHEILKERFYNTFPFDRERYCKGLREPFIEKIADKRSITKAFKDTDLEFTNRKGGPGYNELMCYGPHNYRFTLGIHRSQGMPRNFRSYFMIMGYNFTISKEYDVCVDSLEEAQDKLNELAKFCMELQGDFFDDLAKEFGDTPSWYWEANKLP